MSGFRLAALSAALALAACAGGKAAPPPTAAPPAAAPVAAAPAKAGRATGIELAVEPASAEVLVDGESRGGQGRPGLG